MTNKKRCIITRIEVQEQKRELLWYMDAQDHPIEIHLHNEAKPSYVGNIYIARVERVMPQINAAFLKAGDLTFFYPMEDDLSTIWFTQKCGPADALCQGDNLVVQVVRDAIKTKEICVTTNISFTGRHLVLTTGKLINGISRKITGERRHDLQTLLEQMKSPDYGVVLRTSAKECSADILLAEYHGLQQEYVQLMERIRYLSCGQQIKAAPHPFFSHLYRYLDDGITEIITDQGDWYTRLMEETICSPLTRRYEDAGYPIYKLYNIPGQLQSALQTKVHLPSGGYLLMEPTETLTVIDVNSGGNTRKKSVEEYSYANNLEAAAEIARQLRLRNISGMILVDFINMKSEEHQQSLLHMMRNATKADYVKVSVLDVTRLGLMELTREKKYPSLREQLLDESDIVC